MTTPETAYLNLLKDILEHGKFKDDRTKTGTKSVFGRQIRFDLAEGFPLLTTKKVFLRGIIHELLWFIRGESNIKYLVENNIHIWDDWPYKYYVQTADSKWRTPIKSGQMANSKQHSKTAEKKHTVLTKEEFLEKIKTDDKFAKKWGELGPVYGVQWRHWKTPDGKEIDQIKNAIAQIKKNPFDRRIIVSAWNVADIEEMAKAGLPPCHSLFQFYVLDGKLSCQLYQRSADMFLGVPFNIASYALLTMIFAQVCGLKLGEFVHTFGDAHIYSNHIEQVKEQLKRKPKKLPVMKLNPDIKDIFEFKFTDFTLEGYDPHPPIKAPVAV